MRTIKADVCRAIDSHKGEILRIGQEILHTPELGYREQRTSALVKEQFLQWGLSDLAFPAVTGVKGWLRGKSHRASVAVMGELDAVLSPEHPFADPHTGAAHACGHNAQIAGMLGCLFGLSAVIDRLDGDVCFMATPAEEYVELAYRDKLRSSGKIAYFGGKQQMIAEGAFDDIDMAMMVHAETNAPGCHIVTGGVSTGFIGKEVRFIGREAHAGGAPWEGINALNAASLALQAIHCLRETFRDEDHIRVHPILTKGGDLVNVVPADVRMESYVRAGNLGAMQAVNAKVNRAIRGAAYAIGAKTQITDFPGYLPLEQNPELGRLFAANAAELLPEAVVENGLPFCGSTDAGDLSFLLPLIQPTVNGFTGALHSKYLRAADQELAYIVPAKLMAMTVVDLLSGGAEAAGAIKSAFPRRSRQEYEALWKKLIEADALQDMD